ncbi:XkdF-like putative serine protease domain-containing protein, partial [Staphylococcus pasteuri_A]|uniref:XkdF-like putative serine protease domain-containing protein n=1 Tax=Staphylococcus pasteuri_A TaxID=3062664 RepID=UPI0034C65981
MRTRFALRMTTKVVQEGEQMLVFGFLSVSTTADGKSVVDSQGDIISTADLEKSAYDYMAEARHVGVDHQKTRGIG